MKKIGVICLALALLLCCLPVSATEATEEIPVSIGCNGIDAQTPFLGTQLLISNATSVVLFETNTETMMYAHNADVQVPPASLLKILTALIAIEKGNMDDAVTVRQEVLSTLAADAAVVELEVDEVLTVRDLLYCMLVGSGNDAAVVLADHVMGSQEAFVAEMNRYAAELGCTNTYFTNVHGLHDANQYTTARDVAKILTKALESELFCDAFGAKYYTVPKTNKSSERYLSTQNYLINNDTDNNYLDTRVTGSRTAVANDYTRSVASVAEVNDMRLICVVIGAKSKYEDDGYTIRVYGGYNETIQLLDLGFNGYKTAQILHKDQVLQQTSVLNGNNDLVLGARSGASSVIPANIDANGLSYRYIDEINLTAPIEKGQTVSKLQIWYGSVCLAETEAYAMNRVAIAGTDFSNHSRDNNGGFLTVILYIFGGLFVVALVFFIGISVMRATQISKMRRNSRRNSRNRRRSR